MNLQSQTLNELSARFNKGWADLEQTTINNASADCDRTGKPWPVVVKSVANSQWRRANRSLGNTLPLATEAGAYFYWLGYREAAKAVHSGQLPFPDSLFDGSAFARSAAADVPGLAPLLPDEARPSADPLLSTGPGLATPVKVQPIPARKRAPRRPLA